MKNTITRPFRPLQLTLTSLLLGSSALTTTLADEPSPWTVDFTLYGLAAGMTGDIGVGMVEADLDVGFDQIWDNLEMGAMAKVRVGYERWSFNTDVIYMGLGASKNGVTADFDQWTVEPTVGYQVWSWVEVLAGVRYNNLSGEIRGPGVLPTPFIRTNTQDWWDPIVGANLSLPLGKAFRVHLRADVGGFGVGSDLTWQAFPFVGWHFSKSWSLQAGYRWVSTDYETGSGSSRFKYDILTHGPQLGVTFRF